MKLENLTFCTKGSNGNCQRISVPAVKVTLVKTGTRKSVGKTAVRVAFHSCAKLYASNNNCRYAIAGNRLYFMFTSSTDNSYKLGISTYHPRTLNYKDNPELKVKSFTVAKDKELSKFVCKEHYTPNLDNECGLYYIEC